MDPSFAALCIICVGLLSAIGSIIGSTKEKPLLVVISVAAALLNWVVSLLIFA